MIPVSIAACLSAVSLWWFRSQPERFPLAIWGTSVAVSSALLALLMAWLRAKKSFESMSDAAVRLEVAAGLHNALTTARQGVGHWPEIRAISPSWYRWNRFRLLTPWATALTMPLMALWLPVPKQNVEFSPSQEMPQSWSRIGSELERLEQQELVETPYLEEVRNQLNKLQSQPEEDWFSHASLEAGDHLEHQLNSETDRLSQAMQQAARSAASLETATSTPNPAERDAQAEQFAEALQQLNQGAMKPNPKLADQLRQITPEQLAELDPQKLEQLRKQLEQQAKQLQPANTPEQAENNEGNGENGDENPGQGEGDPAPHGNGDVQRGPGHDPKWAGKQRERTDSGDLTAIPPRNLSNAAPGDLLGLESGEHLPQSPSPILPPSASPMANGNGGGRVWETPLDPSEQRALKRFFE